MVNTNERYDLRLPTGGTILPGSPPFLTTIPSLTTVPSEQCNECYYTKEDLHLVIMVLSYIIQYDDLKQQLLTFQTMINSTDNIIVNCNTTLLLKLPSQMTSSVLPTLTTVYIYIYTYIYIYNKEQVLQFRKHAEGWIH